MRVLKLICVLVFLFAMGCEQSSDTLVAIPQMNLECNSTDNPTCSTNSFTCTPRQGFVYLTRSGCGDDGNYSPVAGGSTFLTCDTQGCSGSVSTWTDQNSNPVTEIISGSISICAYIDTNCSSIDDSSDLINYQDSFINSSISQTIDSWSVL